MMDQDQLERKFQTSFNDFEVAPPDYLWQNLTSELHPPPKQVSFWDYFSDTNPFSRRRFRAYSLAAMSFVVLFFVLIYFVSMNGYSLRGSVYKGEARLTSGTAILFRLDDHATPWDSLKHYRSALIGPSGTFKFDGVGKGKYLLRVEPDAEKGQEPAFKPSWYDTHEEPAESNVITISDGDVSADVHLVPKDVPKFP